jgi:dipeptidase E
MLEKEIKAVKICIIPTAAKEQKEKHHRMVAAKNTLYSLGFERVDFLDVDKDDVTRLAEYDVVYIGGGNPFYLLEQIKTTGAEQEIRAIVEKGGILIGVSAGSLVLGPNLKVAQYFTPALNSANSTTEGMGLFSFLIMPHSDRENLFPGDVSIESRLKRLVEEIGVTIVRLKDSEACVIHGDAMNIVGESKSSK